MRFNLRVYGLLIEDGKVLVSDELIRGKGITKFPGGGLEFGEGTIEALKREFKEELDTEIHIRRHYYTTDFYVPSAYDDSQVVSIYYLIKPLHPLAIPVSEKPHDYRVNARQGFRFLSLNTIGSDDFSLIIDKHVGGLLAADRFLV
jgi:8-oxo-dGTP pyrophosphatase MutT (NUDIX family)